MNNKINRYSRNYKGYFLKLQKLYNYKHLLEIINIPCDILDKCEEYYEKNNYCHNSFTIDNLPVFIHARLDKDITLQKPQKINTPNKLFVVYSKLMADKLLLDQSYNKLQLWYLQLINGNYTKSQEYKQITQDVDLTKFIESNDQFCIAPDQTNYILPSKVHTELYTHELKNKLKKNKLKFEDYKHLIKFTAIIKKQEEPGYYKSIYEFKDKKLLTDFKTFIIDFLSKLFSDITEETEENILIYTVTPNYDFNTVVFIVEYYNSKKLNRYQRIIDRLRNINIDTLINDDINKIVTYISVTDDSNFYKAHKEIITQRYSDDDEKLKEITEQNDSINGGKGKKKIKSLKKYINENEMKFSDELYYPGFHGTPFTNNSLLFYNDDKLLLISFSPEYENLKNNDFEEYINNVKYNDKYQSNNFKHEKISNEFNMFNFKINKGLYNAEILICKKDEFTIPNNIITKDDPKDNKKVIFNHKVFDLDNALSIGDHTINYQTYEEYFKKFTEKPSKFVIPDILIIIYLLFKYDYHNKTDDESKKGIREQVKKLFLDKDSSNEDKISDLFKSVNKILPDIFRHNDIIYGVLTSRANVDIEKVIKQKIFWIIPPNLKDYYDKCLINLRPNNDDTSKILSEINSHFRDEQLENIRINPETNWFNYPFNIRHLSRELFNKIYDSVLYYKNNNLDKKEQYFIYINQQNSINNFSLHLQILNRNDKLSKINPFNISFNNNITYHKISLLINVYKNLLLDNNYYKNKEYIYFKQNKEKNEYLYSELNFNNSKPSFS